MKALQIEIDGKEYTLGYFTRKDVKLAEKKGLRITKMEDETVTQTDKLFYTGLLAKHPEITEEEAEKLEQKFVEQEGDLSEIIQFLVGQFANFIQSQNGKKTKKKITKIVEL